MAKISSSQYKKMKNCYDHDVAVFLANLATKGDLITYGNLSKEFGRTPRGWGDTLGGIAIRCHEASLPLLPVIVVNAETRQPSVDAVLYTDLGLPDSVSISEEQKRCFAFDWQSSLLMRAAR